MVETIGICEKHELPLDGEGECELCRLSDIPSKAPPARSAWWAVIIPVVIVLLGALLTYRSIGTGPDAPTEPGVQPVAPAPEPSEVPPAKPEPPEAEPEPVRAAPPASPVDAEDLPRPEDFQQ